MGGSFSKDFPDGFEKELTDNGAKQQDFPKVYRIMYDGSLTAENFESTYASGIRRRKRFTKAKLANVGTYSTSCFEELSDAKYIKKNTMKDPPQAMIAEGPIEAFTGYSQRTSERDESESTSHIDWWIFSTTDIEKNIVPRFRLCKEGNGT